VCYDEGGLTKSAVRGAEPVRWIVRWEPAVDGNDKTRSRRDVDRVTGSFDTGIDAAFLQHLGGDIVMRLIQHVMIVLSMMT
jgi:hypothetical protein